MFTNDELIVIKTCFNCNENNIVEIGPIGSMTNQNILFSVNNEKYIFRRAGAGSSELVNRENEYTTYNVIKKLDISDKIIYINHNGTKITKYIENAHTCNPNDEEEVRRCMRVLRSFHNIAIQVDYAFDLFENINKYEKLMGHSKYKDYDEVKHQVFNLTKYLPKTKNFVLTHIDPNQDNFLITDKDVKLIDWEYAAMQDANVDLAMFAIYAGYNKQQIDRLIELYYTKIKSGKRIKKRVYTYVAICGLLWSNWCEYKEKFGITFGDYALSQYNYAKEFSKGELYA